jgi:hypothetical protein
MPKGALHSAMWQLASCVTEIDSLMRNPAAEPLDHDRIVALLATMDAVAKRLSEPDLRGAHPVLSANVDTFARDVRDAWAAAQSSPPNYYLAGAVAGACVYCHDPEGGIR